MCHIPSDVPVEVIQEGPDLTQSPRVPREAYIPIAIVIVLLQVIIILNESYSRGFVPASLTGRIFFTIFRSGRWLFTWPIVPATVLAVYTLAKRLTRQRDK